METGEVSNSVHCYLVEWEAFVERAAANRTAEGIDWFWFAVEDRELWVLRYADLAPKWDASGHRWTDEGLTYDDFRDALALEVQAPFDRFFHTLLPSSVEGKRVVELPTGVAGWSGTNFYAALSPGTATELRTLVEGLEFGVLWPAFRKVLGEDDAPPPDAAEQLAAGFEEFRGYVTQWLGPVVGASERGWGLVVP
jgi:hypothetical protein